jgi:ribosomal protein L40E
LAEFLNTQKAYAEITDLVCKAQRYLVFISPYIKMPPQLMVRLSDFASKGGKTTIVYGKEELKANTLEELSQIKNLDLKFLKDLHAKCFYNETHMVITSLNLHDYSQNNNYEMGILLKRDVDSSLFREAVEEASFIIRSAVPHETPKPVEYKLNDKSPSFVHETPKTIEYRPRPKASVIEEKKSSTTDKIVGGLTSAFSGIFGPEQGHCIHCGKQIDYDREKPYCPDCYSTWSKWKNVEYAEKVCHKCGESHKTSMAKPICRKCYAKEQD